MGLKDLELVKKIDFGVMTIVGCLVLILGFFLFNSVTSQPQASELVRSPERRPASLPSHEYQIETSALTHSKSDLSGGLQTLTLECQSRRKLEKIPTKAQHLRLRMLSCGSGGQEFDIKRAKVVNQTNGYQATLFAINNDGFTSDYISLSEGENKILVELGRSGDRVTGSSDQKGVETNSVYEVWILRGQ